LSHTASVQVHFRHREALAEACRALGFPLERLKHVYAVQASIRAVERTGRRVLQRVEQNGHVQLVVQ